MESVDWSMLAYFSNLFQEFKEHYGWSKVCPQVILRPMCVWSIGKIVFRNVYFEILVVVAPYTVKQLRIKCHVGFQQHLSAGPDSCPQKCADLKFKCSHLVHYKSIFKVQDV